MNIHYFAATDIGLDRDKNEDAYTIINLAEHIQLYLIADGMGGLHRGEMASGMIIEAVKAIRCPQLNICQHLLEKVLLQINQQIRQYAQEHQVKLGSTFIALIADQKSGQAICSWAGDSRLYRWRQNELEQISKDHSQVQQLLDHQIITEEEAIDHPASHLITNGIGIREELRIEQLSLELQSGDHYLLCSDGISNELDTEQIEQALRQPPQPAVNTLIEFAKQKGGRDNMTAICIQID